MSAPVNPGHSSRHLIAAGWAGARMAMEKFDELERTMTMEATKPQSVEDIFESEAGCRMHRAIKMLEAKSYAEGAFEEFEHDPDFPVDVLEALRVVKDADIRL